MKLHIVLFGLAVLALGLLTNLGPFGSAEAFCIYNRTDQKMGVIQESGGKLARSFQANLDPGAHACCNWKNKDCNKKGHKTSILTFSVPWRYADDDYYCSDVRVQAGGWMTIEGKGKDIKCHAHDAD